MRAELNPTGARRPFSVEGRRILYAFLSVILIFFLGQILRHGFLSFTSVKAILAVASFVGLVAAGQFFVVLVGGIDLSVPWVLNAAAIVLVTTSLGEDSRAALSIGVTLLLALSAGALNGIGVSILRIPPVVMTLAMNGLIQGLTLGASGGLTCASCASYAPATVRAAVHGTILGVPGIILLWIVVIVAISTVLSLTVFGRVTYAVGNNVRASLLSGVNVKAVTVSLYALSGLFSGLAGIAVAGYGGQAALGIGDPYLFQSITAVVIGGVYVLGGRGHYIGVVAGSISLIALTSILMVVNIPEFGRSIIYGLIVISLLLLYGREDAER